jgi:hypothetical protein
MTKNAELKARVVTQSTKMERLTSRHNMLAQLILDFVRSPKTLVGSPREAITHQIQGGMEIDEAQSIKQAKCPQQARFLLTYLNFYFLLIKIDAKTIC